MAEVTSQRAPVSPAPFRSCVSRGPGLGRGVRPGPKCLKGRCDFRKERGPGKVGWGLCPGAWEEGEGPAGGTDGLNAGGSWASAGVWGHEGGGSPPLAPLPSPSIPTPSLLFPSPSLSPPTPSLPSPSLPPLTSWACHRSPRSWPAT